jgi:hypothetical protein
MRDPPLAAPHPWEAVRNGEPVIKFRIHDVAETLFQRAVVSLLRRVINVKEISAKPGEAWGDHRIRG